VMQDGEPVLRTPRLTAGPARTTYFASS
jgi:hypothetical protein